MSGCDVWRQRQGVALTNLRTGDVLQTIALLTPTVKSGDAWWTGRVVERLYWLNGAVVSRDEAAGVLRAWRADGDTEGVTA